jgi:Trk K+ transport system NAD-binding subunit
MNDSVSVIVTTRRVAPVIQDEERTMMILLDAYTTGMYCSTNNSECEVVVVATVTVKYKYA